jgi:hypothetical protein
MTQFVIFPSDPSLKRSDRKNIFIVAEADAEAALERCEQLCGDTSGAFSGWNAIPLNDSASQDMVIESSHATPVGTRENGNIWPKLLSSGDPLAV